MRFLALLSLLTLVSCSTLPPAAGLRGKWKNDCLPQAAAMATALNEKNVQAKVLLIDTPSWRHAVVVYLFPAGANTLWIWDSNWKSLRVRAYFSDPGQCARAWLNLVSPGATLTSATFL